MFTKFNKDGRCSGFRYINYIRKYQVIAQWKIEKKKIKFPQCQVWLSWELTGVPLEIYLKHAAAIETHFSFLLLLLFHTSELFKHGTRALAHSYTIYNMSLSYFCSRIFHFPVEFSPKSYAIYHNTYRRSIRVVTLSLKLHCTSPVVVRNSLQVYLFRQSSESSSEI